MEWLEQNIDAYRIISEILGELRQVVRQRLEQIHGDEWYREGLPEEVYNRLVAAKEREKSIDWYEGQYQQIMDYAVFADLIEIIEYDPEAFPVFMELAPSAALLTARFLELDVMRGKLGRARPISETELSFLGTFHLRFKKAAQQAKEKGAAVPAENESPQPIEPPPPEPPLEPRPEPVSPVEPPQATESERKPTEPGDEIRPNSPTSTPAASESTEDAVATSPSATVDPGPAEPEVAGPESVKAEPSETSEDVDEPDDEVAAVKENEPLEGAKKLERALLSNEHKAVLRELYREVTAIAEGVWSSEVTPAPLVWEQVTASEWYEENFSRLGLHPLSVFYEVASKVDRKVVEGADRKELQEFLKETNFAKTLLSLRDMFQANDI
ncbi:MAG: hypothetical protein P8127_07895 [Acidobacteriota bacterium]